MDRVFYIQLYHLEFDRDGRTVYYDPIPEVFRTEEEATNSLPNYYVVMANGWLVLQRPFIAAMGELVRKEGDAARPWLAEWGVPPRIREGILYIDGDYFTYESTRNLRITFPMAKALVDAIYPLKVVSAPVALRPISTGGFTT